MLRQKIVRPLIRLVSTQTKNQRGLMEFFRDTSDYGRPEFEKKRHGQPMNLNTWSSSPLNSFMNYGKLV